METRWLTPVSPEVEADVSAHQTVPAVERTKFKYMCTYLSLWCHSCDELEAESVGFSLTGAKV